MCISAAASGGHDTSTLQSVLQHDAAGFARAMCTALRAEAPSPSSTGTVLERIAVADAGSQTTDDMIDVLTAEAIVAEALQVGDELAAKQAEAEHHASQLDCALSKAQAQLGAPDRLKEIRKYGTTPRRSLQSV